MTTTFTQADIRFIVMNGNAFDIFRDVDGKPEIYISKIPQLMVAINICNEDGYPYVILGLSRAERRRIFKRTGVEIENGQVYAPTNKETQI